MGNKTDELTALIMDAYDELESLMQEAISEKPGAKRAARQARKKTLELEKLMKEYRKVSVQDIG